MKSFIRPIKLFIAQNAAAETALKPVSRKRKCWAFAERSRKIQEPELAVRRVRSMAIFTISPISWV